MYGRSIISTQGNWLKINQLTVWLLEKQVIYKYPGQS